MNEKRGPIKRFFGGIGRILSVTRSVLSALFSLFFILFFFILLGSLLSERQLDIPDNGALRIEINGSLVDQATYPDPISRMISPNAPRQYVVREVIESVEMAANDERINSIILVLHNMQGGGISKVSELGQALLEFRESGKPVIALSDSYNQLQYLLASYASEIILHPMGMVDIRGFAAYQSYLGEALQNLSVNMHVFRTGEYKDAVEPLIDTAMSESSREQNQALLDDIWQSYREGILQRRQIESDNFAHYVDNFDQALLEAQGDGAQMALEYGLVDRVMPRDESLAHSVDIAGANDNQDFYSHVNLMPYYQLQQLGPDREEAQIGLVVASGTIYDGIQSAGAIGGDSLAYLLRQTRENEDLDALVVRIDSPGGSAVASELVRRELSLFREQGIPVVVSMGSVAASGGYWIATAADHIVATPTTITGSIGVFALFPTLEDSLARLGVYSDGVKTAPLADAMQLDRPLDERAGSVVQARVDFIYDRFLDLVAGARSIPEEQVGELAGGRVWSGQQALELNLVDELGDQFAAEQAAANLAGLEEFEVRLIEPPLSFAERLARMIGQGVSVLVERILSDSGLNQLRSLLGDSVQSLELTDPQSLFLYCSLCSLTDDL